MSYADATRSKPLQKEPISSPAKPVADGTKQRKLVQLKSMRTTGGAEQQTLVRLQPKRPTTNVRRQRTREPQEQYVLYLLIRQAVAPSEQVARALDSFVSVTNTWGVFDLLFDFFRENRTQIIQGTEVDAYIKYNSWSLAIAGC